MMSGQRILTSNPRSVRRYTPEEDVIILNMRLNYALYRIAEVVGRSTDSVRQRFKALGLSRKVGRGPTPQSVATEMGMGAPVVYRIANYLFGPRPRGRYLTQEQVDEMIEFIIEAGYKCKLNPKKKNWNKGEQAPDQVKTLRPSWDRSRSDKS